MRLATGTDLPKLSRYRPFSTRAKMRGIQLGSNSTPSCAPKSECHPNCDQSQSPTRHSAHVSCQSDVFLHESCIPLCSASYSMTHLVITPLPLSFLCLWSLPVLSYYALITPPLPRLIPITFRCLVSFILPYIGNHYMFSLSELDLFIFGNDACLFCLCYIVGRLFVLSPLFTRNSGSVRIPEGLCHLGRILGYKGRIPRSLV